MAKKTLLFCNGLSGTGKTTFIQNYAVPNGFYNLISATTRQKRPEETDGVSYYFRDEKYFETEKFATKLWVNEFLWKSGEPKWLYGIPESEINKHIGENLVYDVIQPRYTCELKKWFIDNKLDEKYEFRVAYFTTEKDNFEIAGQRATMPDDMKVRRANTCTPDDFKDANVDIDFTTMPLDGKPNLDLIKFVRSQNNR